jgi:hypothetical protein
MEGKVPHIRMDNGSAIEVYRKQAKATRNLQVSSKPMFNGKNDLKSVSKERK